VQGTVPAFSFSCSARRQERRLEPPVCVQTARRRHSRRAFRKTPCSSKQAQVLESRVFPGNSRTTHLGPFGELIRATGPAAKLNPLRFSTKFTDDEIGLLYYGYRYYNPSTGRWPSRDPKGELGFELMAHKRTLNKISRMHGLASNPYAFVRNSPVSLTDRLGLDCKADCHQTFQKEEDEIKDQYVDCMDLDNYDCGSMPEGPARAACELAAKSACGLLSTGQQLGAAAALWYCIHITCNHICEKPGQYHWPAHMPVYPIWDPTTSPPIQLPPDPTPPPGWPTGMPYPQPMPCPTCIINAPPTSPTPPPIGSPYNPNPYTPG
jgi:RHS repeat-associated protein